jgi:hypothetical protein
MGLSQADCVETGEPWSHGRHADASHRILQLSIPNRTCAYVPDARAGGNHRPIRSWDWDWDRTETRPAYVAFRALFRCGVEKTRHQAPSHTKQQLLLPPLQDARIPNSTPDMMGGMNRAGGQSVRLI